MKKIDTNKIRGHWQEVGTGKFEHILVAGGDDTIKSIKMIAEKINEIVDWINDYAEGVNEMVKKLK